MGQAKIIVRGARENNLNDVNVSIPRGSLTTITGVSGSGKSSLAFDTIHNEGQRRFLESLSSYARQFLGQIEKPEVDQIEGLSPTVSIDQKTVNRNPRSTVGTITEVYDFLRLLFARLGIPYCPRCDVQIQPQTTDQIRDALLEGKSGRDIVVLAPIVKDRKGEYRKELEDLRMKGFVRARIDGELRRLDEEISLARYVRHTIEVVVDRIRVSKSKKSRLAEAVESALALADGVVNVLDGEEHTTWSSRMACPECGLAVPELEPRMFSFNSPHGACSTCDGLGVLWDVDSDLVVSDHTVSIAAGAIGCISARGVKAWGGVSSRTLPSIAKHYGFELDTPWGDLDEDHQYVLLWGSDGEPVPVKTVAKGSNWKVKSDRKEPLAGVIEGIRDAYDRTGARHLERYLADVVCRDCSGTRLKKVSRSVRFRGNDIHHMVQLSVDELRTELSKFGFSSREKQVGAPIMKELDSRLEFLAAVGLGYITLDRSAATLSGGESQRIRLATQVGARLKGILYVLDEPSIGLHQRDNKRLIGTLEELRDLGNTVCVVEHDQETMERSDYLIDVGPGAGVQGGNVVCEGTFSQVRQCADSVTADYLTGKRVIPVPVSRREAGKDWVGVRGARHHNLQNVDVDFPVGCFTVVTGVSGSGKSTLIDDILKRALAARFHGAKDKPGRHDRLVGLQHIDKVIEIDQRPIGRTPRSNPATYTKVFDLIRELFARVPESKVRDYKKGRFSFNVAGGRCEECSGAGVRMVSMQFLPDVAVTCDVCAGRRFNPETLEIHYRGMSILDVLEMSVSEAATFFENHPRIMRILNALLEVGLGYIRLGQPATTLSGGEAQRLKLASELRRPATGRTLYILDEPTTGLHFEDIERLINALQRLVGFGNTVIVVEHNLEVIKIADWIVDLGPEGGPQGGEVVYTGSLDGIRNCTASHTGEALNLFLDPPRRRGGRRRVVTDLSTGGDIVVKGARTHNLKGIDVRIPTGGFVVVTGPSGSGKTSLAFDTIFAEGQRRFVESLSSYARQFLGRLEKAPVDSIDGLAPSIAIDQKNSSRNPRSTVATTTEIHDYLRLLYARIGRAHCTSCGDEMKGWDPDRVWQHILAGAKGHKGRIVAPLYSRSLDCRLSLGRPAELRKKCAELRSDGWLRVLVDGEEVRLDARLPALSRVSEIWLVVDRVAITSRAKTRVLDAVEKAWGQGGGLCGWSPVDGDPEWFSRKPGCVPHGQFREEDMAPRMFSFNSHWGSCPVCSGVGVTRTCVPELLVNRPHRPLLNGAMTTAPGKFFRRKSFFRRALKALAAQEGFDLDLPWEDLDDRARDLVMNGCEETVAIRVIRRKASGRSSMQMNINWPGLGGYVERWHHETSSERWRGQMVEVMRTSTCRSCSGRRLKPSSLAVTIGGRNIAEVCALTVEAASDFFETLRLEEMEHEIAHRALGEVKNRLRFLLKVGLGYLSLDRTAATLSGGEAQRIRLATQIGSRLTGVIYVLDEPTIGLHQRDTQRLLETLNDLKALGNTILVVEHDEETMEAADHIIDLGPGAGHRGGEVVYQGPRSGLGDCRESLTAAYITGRERFDIPSERRKGHGRDLVIRGVCTNNLDSVDARFPMGQFAVVTGVSGSGKSSLVVDTLVPAVAATLRPSTDQGGVFDSIEGTKHLSDMIVIDQSPIGRTPKSNPATYTGVFDDIRKVFSQSPAARMKGFMPGRFSFNAKGGRCDACSGRGSVCVEMNFLADVWITCEVCRGRRYNSETLVVEYRGKTIADILEMEVIDALEFFGNHRRIAAILGTLRDVGLGYIKLGQPSNTLSGGEAQRIKLSRELARTARGEVLYVLDEPTTGLHFDDVRKLTGVLHRLVDRGNTVVVIEHNLDVVMCADHVIDLGPEGGDQGGQVVAVGAPEDIAKCTGSHTATALAGHMHQRRKGVETALVATMEEAGNGIPA